MSNKAAAYHHITPAHGSCFILLAARNCMLKDCLRDSRHAFSQDQ
jgi:hypothetical protein